MKKNIAIIVACVFTLTLKAQNDPFGIGTYNPESNLHIHSTTLEPLGGDYPINPPRDGIFPNNYIASFQMTNPNSGATVSDGFRITLRNWDVNMMLKESGAIAIGNNNHRFYFTSGGELGVGDSSLGGGYRLYVYGTSGFDGNVSMLQDLAVQGKLNVTGKTTVNKLVVQSTSNFYGKLISHKRIMTDTLLAANEQVNVYSPMNVKRSFRVGNGMSCDTSGYMKVKHLKVTLIDWPDYVFTPEHRLMSLGELESYLEEHSHLPGVPTAEEVENEGADLGEMNKVLMEKVEELTLYIIDLQKQIDELKSNR